MPRTEVYIKVPLFLSAAKHKYKYICKYMRLDFFFNLVKLNAENHI